MNTDFSSGAMSTAIPAADGSIPGVQTYDVNNTTADAERNWFVRLFTGTSEADKQDFNRAEMSANNQFWRDLALQNNANAFSRDEAQKQRDFEERMSNTAYQRAVEDMKVAGINPVLMLPNQGGASTPQGVAASPSGARSGGSNYSSRVQDNSAAIMAQIAGAIIGSAFKYVVAGQQMDLTRTLYGIKK